MARWEAREPRVTEVSLVCRVFLDPLDLPETRDLLDKMETLERMESLDLEGHQEWMALLVLWVWTVLLAQEVSRVRKESVDLLEREECLDLPVPLERALAMMLLLLQP